MAGLAATGCPRPAGAGLAGRDFWGNQSPRTWTAAAWPAAPQGRPPAWDRPTVQAGGPAAT
eukprot:9882327-Alexandrium_andersonii.AAC.1